MEINVKREDLVRGLHSLQGVAERRGTVPILANVLIEAGERGIAMVATDMEIGLRVQAPAQVKRKGVTTVNARKLYEIAREVTGEEVTLRASATGWVDVLAGRSKFKVVALDAKDFPELPLGPNAGARPAVHVAVAILREMIDKSLFAVSQDESRFNLSGVCMEVTEDAGGLRFVATDGHRLALIDRPVPDAKLPQRVIMPRKGLLELRKLIDEVGDAEAGLTVAEKDVRVHTASTSFFMRLVEGEFPDYRQVIPGSTRAKVTVNRDELFAALRRASLLASERSHGVRLHVERGVLELSASNPDQGEVSEEVEVSYSGDPVTVGFNARYLLDVLSVHAEGETIELGLSDEVGPGVLRSLHDPAYTYVVMPMRL
jgi:DNA polymerase-3 subunit beta